MSTLLLSAAQSAAAADGVAPLNGGPNAQMGNMQPPQQRQEKVKGGGNNNNNNNNSNKGPPLRRGKWTAEEEAYANRLIQEFKAGLLPLTDGTTLRTFLSKLLNCDPMRISKKFVGSNCIGKQVFRRRTTDLQRLTPEQIQKSRAELSELERRFLERVAQTNRVKSNSMVGGGSGGPGTPPPAAGGGGNHGQGGFPLGSEILGGSHSNVNANAAAQLMAEQHRHAALLGMNANGGGGNPFHGMNGLESQQMPPWLMPPSGYKPGHGAAFAAANLSSNPSAAAAGRALLGGLGGSQNSGSSHHNQNNNNNNQNNNNSLMHRDPSASGLSVGSQGGSNADLLAQLQRRASQQSFLRDALGGSSGGLSSAALAQLAQNASAARLAGLGSNASLADLFRSGSGGDAAAMAAARGLSAASLTNAMNRKNSFDALMSLDFQSLQSIDNLANLIQTGGAPGGVPSSGMKNADFGSMMMGGGHGGPGSHSNLSAAQRLSAANHMSSLLSASRGLGGAGGGASASSLGGAATNPHGSANFQNLLRSMQEKGGSAASLFSGFHSQAAAAQGGGGGGNSGSNHNMASPSAVNLANLLRQDSSTGLSALRVQDGLSQRNSSVDDFLSLMAAGDIPHQDPSLLNIPLMAQQQQQQQNGGGGGGNNEAAARLLAQQHQQFLQSNPALANALSHHRSLANLQQAMIHERNGGGGGAGAGGGGEKRKAEDMGDYSQQSGKSKRTG